MGEFDELVSPHLRLIVHVQAEQVQGRIMVKVLHVWKGEHNTSAFAKQPPKGYINPAGPEGDAKVRKSSAGAIPFDMRRNQPKEGISRWEMIVLVSDGKLIYGPGVMLPFSK